MLLNHTGKLQQYIIARKTRSSQAWKKFKTTRQTAKEELRTSQKTYTQGLIGDSLAENTKPFWSYIKSRRRDNSSVPTLKTKSGIPPATDQTKANVLVNQFSSIFTTENRENIPSLPQVYPDMPDINFWTRMNIQIIKQHQSQQSRRPRPRSSLLPQRNSKRIGTNVYPSLSTKLQ